MKMFSFKIKLFLIFQCLYHISWWCTCILMSVVITFTNPFACFGNKILSINQSIRWLASNGNLPSICRFYRLIFNPPPHTHPLYKWCLVILMSRSSFCAWTLFYFGLVLAVIQLFRYWSMLTVCVVTCIVNYKIAADLRSVYSIMYLRLSGKIDSLASKYTSAQTYLKSKLGIKSLISTNS